MLFCDIVPISQERQPLSALAIKPLKHSTPGEENLPGKTWKWEASPKPSFPGWWPVAPRWRTGCAPIALRSALFSTLARASWHRIWPSLRHSIALCTTEQNQQTYFDTPLPSPPNSFMIDTAQPKVCKTLGSFQDGGKRAQSHKEFISRVSSQRLRFATHTSPGVVPPPDCLATGLRSSPKPSGRRMECTADYPPWLGWMSARAVLSGMGMTMTTFRANSLSLKALFTATLTSSLVRPSSLITGIT